MKREEFEQTLLHPLEDWQNKSQSAVEELLGTDVGKMVGFEQKNPHHCYDLFEHTLYTVAAMPPHTSNLLLTAAFFHDIGKTVVAKEKRGYLVFYGHALESVRITKPILQQFGYVKRDIDEILFYIQYHDDFISWVLPEDPVTKQNRHLKKITQQNLQKRMEQVMQKNSPLFLNTDAYKIWRNLLLLCEADAKAQADAVYRDGQLIDSRAHKVEKIKRLLELSSFLQRVDNLFSQASRL